MVETQGRYGTITLLEADADNPRALSYKVVAVHLFDRHELQPAHELDVANFEAQVDFLGDPAAALAWLCTECRALMNEKHR